MQTVQKHHWMDSTSHAETTDEEREPVTHPSTLNPFFSLSPEALAEEARANQVCGLGVYIIMLLVLKACGQGN